MSIPEALLRVRPAKTRQEIVGLVALCTRAPAMAPYRLAGHRLCERRRQLQFGAAPVSQHGELQVVLRRSGLVAALWTGRAAGCSAKAVPRAGRPSATRS
jgi:hypothetical protein